MKEESREYLIGEMGKVLGTFQTLDRYSPEVADALVALRRALIPGMGKAGSGLDTKYKELIMVSIEVATGRGEKGISHARKAVRAGATPQEVHEALALCIYIVGMSSWVDAGVECVLAAEEEQERIKRGEKFTWSAGVTDPSIKG